MTQLAGDDELPIVVLDYGIAESDAGVAPALAAEMREEVDAKVRDFVRPVVIDIGAGSKTLKLTLDQLGQDGEVLERREVLIAYHDDDSVRPSFRVMKKFIDLPEGVGEHSGGSEGAGS